MKKCNLCIVLFCFVIGIVSCDNSLEPFESSRKSFSDIPTVIVQDTVIETLEFVYKGESYYSLCASVDDSIISIFDAKTAAIWQKFEELPEVQTYIHDDGRIEYFDKRADLEKNIGSEVMLRSRIPIVVSSGSFEFFDDVDYKDRHYLFQLWGGESACKNLKTTKYGDQEMNFNDKISSMKLFGGNVSSYGYICIRFLFWEDDSFKGRALIIDLNGERKDIPNLKKIKVAGSSKSWNDRISSFEIFPYPINM